MDHITLKYNTIQYNAMRYNTTEQNRSYEKIIAIQLVKSDQPLFDDKKLCICVCVCAHAYV
jgi:hypothetical protein